MVSLCDKDASRTTIAEMDALDARFVCEACDGNGIETVMTWRSAVRSLTSSRLFCVHFNQALHVMERHRSGFGQARLVKASDEHATIARSVEQAAAEKVAAKADARTGGGWCCSACDLPRYDSKADVLRHLGQEYVYHVCLHEVKTQSHCAGTERRKITSKQIFTDNPTRALSSPNLSIWCHRSWS